MNRIFGGVASLALLLAMTAPAAAQAPPEVDGELVHVPLIPTGELASGIVLDGDLGDWATLPAIVTNDGPVPSTDPANSGQMRWQVAADSSTLFFAATITDDNIVAGQHGDDYWNEDSIELYLNVSGDLLATTSGDGIGQITISPVDRGNTDPTQLTVSGSGAPQFGVTGFVFATTAGWGLEIAVDLGSKLDLVDQAEFGLQVQANGSSGGDRDLKLSWSNADVDDVSFQDPSVFGRAVLLLDPAVLPAETVEETEAAVVDTDTEAVAATDDAAVVETIAQPDAADNEPKESRTLLIAAIFSAASILVGGSWFEHRRKKSEAASSQLKLGDALAESAEENLEDRDALIASILDSEEE